MSKKFKRDGSASRCAGCGRPCYTAFCDSCAPSSVHTRERVYGEIAAPCVARHNGQPINLHSVTHKEEAPS